MMKGILTLIPLGFGEIFGSMGIGKVVDTFGSKKASYYIIVSIIFQTVITLSFIGSGVYGFIEFLMTFSWGV